MNRIMCVFFIIILSICISLSACSDNRDIVLVVLKTSSNPFFTSMLNSIEHEFLNYNNSFELVIIAPSDPGDYLAQLSALERYYNNYVRSNGPKKIRALILTPSASGSELLQTLKLYNQSSIPVILVDTLINSEDLEANGVHYEYFIGSDNYKGGELAADYIIEKTRVDKPQILLLNGNMTHETANTRREGFMSRINSFSSKGIVVIERTCNWDRNEADMIVSSLIRSGQKVDAIFAANDEMAIGASNAYYNNNKEIPLIIGFDYTVDAIKYISEKRISASIRQSPEEMGKQAALYAIAKRASRGETVLIPVEVMEK